MIDLIVFSIGLTLLTIGTIFDLIGSIGLLKFPNFYIRLHAATIGAIGGAVVPLIGLALIALSLGPDVLPNNYAISGACFVTALLILIVAPTGSHALAYATHKARVVEWNPVCDHLKEDEVK
ncbi:MAG: monovalent cation/H(+) antiporter subunit G [Desulfurococcaceae archaeon]|uniref:Monovalent cation/H+ antiporter subunit G n=1 Tax=Staphylothermus marinus TaxID=2280 RepID=A0A7C4HBU8_STAMA